MGKETWTDPSGTKTRWLIYHLTALAVITAGVLFSYQGVLESGFVNYDDPLYVTDNPIVQDGVTATAVKRAFTEFYANFWHPLTVLSHMADVQLFGFNPHGHHLTSLLIHLFCVWLLYLLIWRMTGNFRVCVLAAALFALHPTHVESVAWISERKDILSTFFGLICLLLYVRYARQPDRRRYIPVFLFALLSLMAKSTLVTLPFLLFLLDYWPLNRIHRFPADGNQVFAPRQSVYRLIVEKIPFLALSVIFSAASYAAQSRGGAVSSVDSLPLSLRSANALWSGLSYLGKTFWPVDLAFFYPYPSRIAAWQILVSSAVLIVITLASIRYWKKAPGFIVGWLWFLGTLFPVIGLVPVGLHAMADRYLYVAHIGLFISIGFGIDSIYRRRAADWIKKGMVAGFIGICVVLAVMTNAQVATWRDSATLFSHAVEVTEKNFMAHHLLAHELTTSGKYPDALAHLEKSIQFNPAYPDAYNNLAVTLFHAGRVREAMTAFQKALELDPAHFDTLNNVGLALFYLKQYQQSEAFYRKALRIQPDNPDLLMMIGKNLLLSGRPEEAAGVFRQVRDILPGHHPGHQEAGQYLDRISGPQNGKTK